MKSIPIALAALTLGLSSCSSTPESSTRNHWHMNSVWARVAHQGFGYDSERDGSYWNRVRSDMSSSFVTLRRHTTGAVYDPENPMMPPSDTAYVHHDPPPNPYDDDNDD